MVFGKPGATSRLASLSSAGRRKVTKKTTTKEEPMRDLVPSRESEPLLGLSAAERPETSKESRRNAARSHPNTPPAPFPWIPPSPLL